MASHYQQQNTHGGPRRTRPRATHPACGRSCSTLWTSMPPRTTSLSHKSLSTTTLPTWNSMKTNSWSGMRYAIAAFTQHNTTDCARCCETTASTVACATLEHHLGAQSMLADWDPEDLMVPFHGYTPWTLVDYNTDDPALKYTVSVDVAAPCDTCFRLFDDVLNWGEWFHIIHRVRIHREMICCDSCIPVHATMEASLLYNVCWSFFARLRCVGWEPTPLRWASTRRITAKWSCTATTNGVRIAIYFILDTLILPPSAVGHVCARVFGMCIANQLVGSAPSSAPTIASPLTMQATHHHWSSSYHCSAPSLSKTK